MNDNLSKMFKVVQDPNFQGWEKVETITEDALINTANAPVINTPVTPNSNPAISNPANPATTISTPVTAPATGFNIGSFVNEKMAVELVDIVGSAGGVMAAKALTKKKLSRAKFRATDDEKKLLEPSMKAALLQANITITNPFEALFWGIVIVYGSKVGIEVLDETMNKAEQKVIGDEIDFTEKKKRGRPRKQ